MTTKTFFNLAQRFKKSSLQNHGVQVSYGEHIRLVGSASQLGGWEVDQAPEMQWSEGNVWNVTVDLPVGQDIHFKYVHFIPEQAPVWEYTSDRTLTVGGGDNITVASEWNVETSATAVTGIEPVVEPEQTKEDLEPSTFLSAPSFKSISDAVEKTFADATKSSSAAVVEEEASETTTAAAIKKGTTTKKQVKKVADNNKDDDDDNSNSNGTEALAVTEEETAIEAEKKSTEDMLKGAAKSIGTVAALGVGAAVLSAFAVDITDVAIMSAVVAGSAALATPSKKKSSKTKTKATTTVDGVEVMESDSEEEEEERPINSEPGVIIAAGLVSAFDTASSMFEGAGSKTEEEKAAE